MKFLFILVMMGVILVMSETLACTYQLSVPQNIKTQDLKAALAKVTTEFDYDPITKIVHFKLEREVTQAEVEKALRSSNLSTVTVGQK